MVARSRVIDSAELDSFGPYADLCQTSAQAKQIPQMAARRPILGAIVVATVAAWLLFSSNISSVPQQDLFVVAAPKASPALRAVHLKGGKFTGMYADVAAPTVTMKALPEPRPNDATDLPVDLNRTSLFWGLLTILILSILFSSYFFN